MRQNPNPFLLTLLTFCLLLPIGLGATEQKHPENIRKLPPITAMQNGEIRSIHLTDIYDHYHTSCAGTLMSFIGIRYGLETLFGDETPDLDDLLVMTLAGGGPLDTLDYILKGGNPADRTWPPPGIASEFDHFIFQFFRKSTLEGTTVSMKPDAWPSDWFELREKFKNKTITEAEEKKRRENRRSVVQAFSTKNPDELYDSTGVYTFIPWGDMTEGEMTRNIRNQRRQNRAALGD
ncbi:hypothetical protein OOT00_08630 [Desulfobotulus sp. H1]|uniref:Formylmethanofuran dehydrogenase subunit E domain-containing protein n=1 Tax=Desulfobotulus pelophilus TaxID=2823377 RepID=A0ABT3N9E1_9BACT|nr:hypothetical protein [Desulfobotulus pelophilus]MCW7754050.1 hypothetical protein [Desulfobotulus pelophilus]